MPRNMDGFMEQVDLNIKKFKWHATGVFPSVKDPKETSSFVYTAGFFEQGLQEYIIFGLSPQTGQAILHTLAEIELKPSPLPRIEVGYNTNILSGGYKAYITDVKPENFRDYFGVAIQRAMYIFPGIDIESAFAARQIIWPDKDGKFPWELDYKHKMWEQPTLGEMP